MVKLKYQSDCLKVNMLVAVMLTIERIFSHQSQQGHYHRHFITYASHICDKTPMTAAVLRPDYYTLRI